MYIRHDTLCFSSEAELLEGASMKTERICYYLKIIILVELLVTLIAWTLVTNLHPLWMQLLAFPYLPILDLITIVVWLACRKLQDQSIRERT